MTEFELIAKFFNTTPKLQSTRLSVGDDCALLKSAKTLALSTDTLVLNTHFLRDADPFLLGQKALMINLSDLAAMGAKPLAFMLALTLPDVNPNWLEPFSQGLKQVAKEYHLDLIGGNTTRGPLNINITIIGELDEDKALKRDRAKTDDAIYVTGTLGGAALGLQILQNKMSPPDAIKQQALARFHTPTARVAFAQDLLGLAHAAIDISDGLAQDLMHMLQASGVGADVMITALPLFPEADLLLALNGGEDYELCFTAPPNAHTKIMALAQIHALPVTRIGTITDHKKLIFLDAQNHPMDIAIQGYQHF